MQKLYIPYENSIFWRNEKYRYFCINTRQVTHISLFRAQKFMNKNVLTFYVISFSLLSIRQNDAAFILFHFCILWSFRHFSSSKSNHTQKTPNKSSDRNNKTSSKSERILRRRFIPLKWQRFLQFLNARSKSAKRI